jgi:cell division protein FtsQ
VRVWDNPRLLNLTAGFLVGIAALVFAAALAVKLLHSPLAPVREVVVTTALERTSPKEIEDALRGRIAGNFFAVNAAEVRGALQQLPWVRSVTVRRVWPDRLEVGIEEHVALARWGSDALVSTNGERFAGRTDEQLPLFVGPSGHEAEMTRRYEAFAAAVAPLGTTVERVMLSPRLAWQLRLANGLHVVLGRDPDAAEARLRRFVGVYADARRDLKGSFDYVDLRYRNGFALRAAESPPKVKG